MEFVSSASVRWQCRRGMLELDILLLPFVDKVYETLAVDQQQDFIELLGYQDQELFAWFIGRSEPESSKLRAIVQLIREGAWKG